MKLVRAICREKLSLIVICAALITLLAALVVSAPRLARAQNPQTSQEAVVAPNENLVVEGIPPIPQSLADQADRYTNFRSAFFASWHPTKRRDADRHALRRHISDSPGENAGRRAHAAHFLR